MAQTIKNRHTTRWYSKRSVPQEILLQVVAAGRNAVPLRPEIEVRWYIVWDGSVLKVHPCDVAGACEDGSHLDLAPGRTSERGPLALISPPHHILAVSQERPGFIENLGFCMEQLILAAAERGLGTCWLAAMSPSDEPETGFERQMAGMVPDLGPQERIVSLTPLGYPARSQPARLAQQLVRWGAAVQSSPVQARVFQDVWGVPWTPHTAQPEPAPSAHATAWTLARQDRALQGIWELTDCAPSWGYEPPWRFIVDDRRVIAVIGTARPPSSPAADAYNWQTCTRLGGGIAMCHFYLAAREVGLLPERTADLATGTTDGLWRVPGSIEREQLGRQHGIPDEYDILGLFPLPVTDSGL